MGSDEYLKWIERQNYEELQTQFIEHEHLEERFEEFLFDRWISEEADYSDYLYEIHKDLHLEEQE